MVIHKEYNGSTQFIFILFFLISCEIIQPSTLMPNYETLKMSYHVASFCFTALIFILAITIPEVLTKIKISIVGPAFGQFVPNIVHSLVTLYVYAKFHNVQ